MKTDVLKVGSKAIIKKKLRKDEIEYTTQIQDIKGDIITILTPMYKSALIRLHEGTRVELIAFDTGKVYEVNGEAGKTTIEGSLYYTDIKVIGNIIKIERRDYFRVKTMNDILVRIKDTENPKEYSEAITIDLSGGGVQFSSTHSFSENNVIEMKLGIDEGEVLLEGELLSQVKQEGLGSYKYTVKFIDLDRVVQEMIVRYVFKVQREKLRR